jgi:hypothetical protein
VLPVTVELAAGARRATMSPRASAVLRDVASQLAGQADGIARTMVRAYGVEIPAYRNITDASLINDVHAVSAAIVRCWLTVMATGQPFDETLLEPLVQGARRRAVQGIDMESMLRAYRIGVRVMWSEITASPACRNRGLEGVMASLATWVLDFADRITTTAAAAYTDEAARAAREREHRRSGLLNVILAGPGPERLRGPDELDVPHCVAVASLPSSSSLPEMERVGHLLERHVDASLWTVRHCSLVAAVPLGGGAARIATQLRRLAADGAALAFGIGERAEGAAETRQSYAEASEALRVGPHVGGRTDGVYAYRDLAPVISLIADPVRARRFADAALAPLLALSDRKWALPTVEAYLSQQGRLKDVASSLGVHPNTVKYRMNEVRPALDSALSDGDRAANVLLAIRIHNFLRAQTR